MKNYLKEEPTRNYDYAEAGGKPYIIIRNKDGSTTKLLIDKNAKYYNDLKRDVERSGTNFNKLRDDFIRRKEAQANSQQEPPKQNPPRQEPPKQNPPRQEPPKQNPPRQDPPRQDPPRQDPPRQDPPRQDPPRQDPPRPRQTPQQKAGLPASVPAAFVPDVVKYQKARQKAVASGDQKQMDKVRDSGMAIWAKLYGPGGKRELKYPTDRQKEIFKQHSSNTTSQTNQPTSQTNQPTSQTSSATLSPSQRSEILQRGAAARQSLETDAQQRGIPKMDDKKLLGKVGAQVKFAKESTNITKEPYDLVLEYLLSEGHADTLDEANYIMLKMDSENIQKIVEAGEGRVNLTYPVGHPKYGQPLKVDGKPMSVSKRTADWNSKMNQYKKDNPEGYKKAKSMMGPYGWTEPPKGYNPPNWM